MNVIYSRSGTGKSRECLKRLEAVIRRGEKAYMIVPEQFSYEAERRLASRLGGTGINGAEALTFGRLLKLLSPSELPAVDSAGKHMLIYKAASKSKNKFFSADLSNNGFIDSISDIISEFKRFNISEDILSNARADIQTLPGSDMLVKKTDMLYEIYKNYNESISGFRDADDDMSRLAALIYSGRELSDVHIFIDEFYSFIPYHYSVIAAMAVKAASVSIFLSADHDAKLSYDTENIFSPTIRIIHSLEKLAKDVGFEINEEHMPEKPYRFIKSEELRLLENSFDKPALKIYDGEVRDIQLFAAGSIFSEIEKAAMEINKSVKDGYRYRDIGMLCGDLENYADIIETVFRNYNIPYFIDMKKNIANHPIIMAVTSIFDIFARNWSSDAVFSYIRTGFSPISDSEADILENFVLAHGIRGEKKWNSEWEYNEYDVLDVDKESAPDSEYNKERTLYINELRKKAAEPFFRFKGNFNGRKTVREICTALFEMLDKDLDMPNKIEKKAREFRDKKMNDESEQFLKLWNILISLLDQAVMVMGDDVCGFEKFSEIITAGLSKYEIGIIPSSSDRVSVGTIDRTRSVNIRKMIIIGANSANIPPSAENRSIFSDSERRRLTQTGLNIEDAKKDRLFDDQFKIYKALTAAKEKLYISWSASDWEGKSMQKAEFVNDIIRRFPNIKTEDNFLKTPPEEYLNAPAEAVFSHILSGWISGADEKYSQLIKWYENSDSFRDRVKAAEYLKNYQRDTRRLSRDTVEKIYGKNHIYSISQLNTFAKCPFQYFLKYGIHAKPQKIWRVENYDAGNFIHHYIDKFCRRIEAEKKDDTLAETKRVWRECNDEKCARITDEFMKDASEQILARGVSGSVGHMLKMMRKNIINAVMDIRDSLNAGEFALDETELPFPDFSITADDGRIINIHGIIDRIDILKDGDRIYIRIVDYKTGKNNFDINKIYNNTEFQLFIYAQAAAEIYKRRISGSADIAGVMYFPLKREFNSVSDFADEAIESNLINMKKLDGIIIDDTDDLKTLKNMDRNIPEKSDYFKSISFKKDGSLKKNSHIVGDKAFKKICTYVNKGAAQADKDISDGDISICPSAGDSDSVCSYCDYPDVCMFNAGKHKKTKKLSGSGFEANIDAFLKEIDGRGGLTDGNDS